MKSEIVEITPDLATEYLEANLSNRPIRQSHVNFLAQEIKAGRWILNGAAIVFNGKQLIDGQHRLWAVITSGKSVKSLVVREVDERAFETIDTGLPRTAGDCLSIVGYKNGSTIASAARICIGYKNKNLLSKVKISNAEIVRFIELNQALDKSCDFIISLSDQARWLISSSLAVSLHFLMSKKDQSLADDYFAGIKSGFSDKSPTPFRLLRERLISYSVSTKKVGRTAIFVFSIKAWNAVRSNKPLTAFRWQDNEEVPEII